MAAVTFEFGGFYRGRRVLVTGDTGFQGSWLRLWLTRLGADVAGFALPPPDDRPSNFVLSRVAGRIRQVDGDLREPDALARTVAEHEPEVVFHLAAQPLVRASLDRPLETFATNVMGTVHVLEALRASPAVRSVVMVTSDKCYRNQVWVWGYRETDALGGHDPYSASKAGAELVIAAYRHCLETSLDELQADTRDAYRELAAEVADGLVPGEVVAAPRPIVAQPAHEADDGGRRLESPEGVDMGWRGEAARVRLDPATGRMHAVEVPRLAADLGF